MAVGVVQNHVRPDRVRLATNIVVAGEGVGVGIGFVLGGLLQSQPCTFAFWVLLMPVAVVLGLIVAVMPGSNPAQVGGRIDYVGVVRFAAGSIVVLLALSEGGARG